MDILYAHEHTHTCRGQSAPLWNVCLQTFQIYLQQFLVHRYRAYDVKKLRGP
jgi:hypothetical protein